MTENKVKSICIIEGDILSPTSDTSKPTVVCHQVNCRAKMGAGLAKQIRDRFPGVYIAYHEKCLAGYASLGDVLCVSCPDYIIANIFGQDGYGNDGGCYTDYDALKAAFNGIAARFSDSTIRIPYKMGCGLGGGNWEKVQEIIYDELVSKNIDVEIWRK